MADQKNKTKKKKARVAVHEGVAHVQASLNNTIVTITDALGNTLCQLSSGALGFKGARKSTPFAAQQVVENVSQTAKELYRMARISIRVKGIGSGRDSAVRAFRNSGIDVTKFEDVTPIPHGGCRPKKERRV